MISKRTNKSNQLYGTPSIALYLQSFSKEELTPFCNWLNQTFHLNFRLSRTSNGCGYFLKTTRVANTLAFLKQVESYTVDLPKFAYKLDWEHRFNQLQHDHPQYHVLSSCPSRPYRSEKCTTTLELKANGWTTKAIAEKLTQTYVSHL